MQFNVLKGSLWLLGGDLTTGSTGRSRETSLEAAVIIQAKEDGGLDQRGSQEVEKQSDYRCILETQSREFASDQMWIVEREEKDSSKGFGWNNYEDGFAIGKSRFGEKIKSSVLVSF